MAVKAKKKNLSAKERDELLATLQDRFKKNMNRHKGLDWAKVNPIGFVLLSRFVRYSVRSFGNGDVRRRPGRDPEPRTRTRAHDTVAG